MIKANDNNAIDAFMGRLHDLGLTVRLREDLLTGANRTQIGELIEAAAVHLEDAGQPLGDAGTSRDKLGRIEGRCPACAGRSLFVAAAGHITCSRLDCANPASVDELLNSEQQPTASRCDRLLTGRALGSKCACGHLVGIHGVDGCPLCTLPRPVDSQALHQLTDRLGLLIGSVERSEERLGQRFDGVVDVVVRSEQRLGRRFDALTDLENAPVTTVLGGGASWADALYCASTKLPADATEAETMAVARSFYRMLQQGPQPPAPDEPEASRIDG